MTVLYNEIDPFAAGWLRNLSDGGHINRGVVDGRSIHEIVPEDLRGVRQFHAFAGIGGWSHALRLAGWPDDRPVWTGSCPCQPFSQAGKRQGKNDARHLWPEWFRLIRECRPRVIFGEQVASDDGLGWLDLVFADLEGEGYAVGAVDLCAASCGAPHIRQRLYFVATLDDATGARWDVQRIGPEGQTRDEARLRGPECGCPSGFVAHSERWAAERYRRKLARTPYGMQGEAREQRLRDDARHGGIVGDPDRTRRTLGTRIAGDDGAPSGQAARQAAVEASPWGDLEWLPCRDGKSRPTQPGLFPLAHGIPGRVGRLRAYGNAIVAPLAAQFIKEYLAIEVELDVLDVGGRHSGYVDGLRQT
jgi:DNA (cytosine-5)-methyltransferase 1